MKIALTVKQISAILAIFLSASIAYGEFRVRFNSAETAIIVLSNRIEKLQTEMQSLREAIIELRTEIRNSKK